MENSKYFKSVLKGTTGSLIFSFIGITLLSLMMTKLVFSKGIFNMIYVIISLCSLSLGAIIGARKNETKGNGGTSSLTKVQKKFRKYKRKRTKQ